MPISNAERQRRYRQRQRDDRYVVAVDVDFAFIDALIDRGLLGASASDDKAAISAAVATILSEWKKYRYA